MKRRNTQFKGNHRHWKGKTGIEREMKALQGTIQALKGRNQAKGKNKERNDENMKFKGNNSHWKGKTDIGRENHNKRQRKQEKRRIMNIAK